MKKEILTEVFNIKNGTIRKKDGGISRIAYIDPETSENTYKYKDKIKNEFDGHWLNSLKTWGWFLGSNPRKVYDTKIKPCLEFLISVEQNPNNEERDVVKIIDKLINEFNETSDSNEVTVVSSSEMKNRLEQFKKDLINCMDSEEFKKRMEPIIKFKRAKGHQFSFANSILIMLQDPNATMVKTKSNWFAVNREVKPGAPAIWLFVPNSYFRYSKEEKEKIKNNFLKKYGVTSINDLSVRQKEDLKILLRSKFDEM